MPDSDRTSPGSGRPEPIETPDRCAYQAQERADPLCGSAFPADRLLLVEQPGPWGRTGLPQSDFDPHLASQLVAAMDRRGIRVLAIRRPGRDHHLTHRRWAWVDCGQGRESVQWGSFRYDAELLELTSGGPSGATSAATVGSSGPAVYLVCAHGTHDVCCAVRGRPVAAALDELRPGRVWECSHVGGDRFAANVLVAPAGLLYGHVHPDGCAALVAATEAGRALAAKLRGRIGWPPAAQAALAAVLGSRPDVASDRVRLLGVRSVGQGSGGPDGSVTVDLDVDGATVVVPVRLARSAPHHLTCRAADLGTVPVFEPQVPAGL